ncbi:MAG: heme exporter protein CcmD [Rhodobiaceae bacterium]|nr:heme exporter protein CcmD [Rhodobiaceae bacterium]
MEFLSGHGAYIAAAYGLSALVLGALTGWIIAERRKLRRALSALEASGVRRRSRPR